MSWGILVRADLDYAGRSWRAPNLVSISWGDDDATDASRSWDNEQWQWLSH